MKWKKALLSDNSRLLSISCSAQKYRYPGHRFTILCCLMLGVYVRPTNRFYLRTRSDNRVLPVDFVNRTGGLGLRESLSKSLQLKETRDPAVTKL